MADYGKGFIVSKSELKTNEYGMNTNHYNGNVSSFLNPTTHKGQLTEKENAIHIMMGLGTSIRVADRRALSRLRR